MSFNSVSKELENIISDNTSGSRELLSKLSTYLKNHLEEINPELISLLQQHFSDFQTIQSFLSNLETAYNNKYIDKFLVEYNEQSIFENMYKNLKPEIEHFNSFITISNSKTILEVFKLAAIEKENIHIYVSEGRPILEGQILAENLVHEKIITSLITEAQIYETVQNCDCGIIGADKILPNGNVINKVGSNLLALACKEFKKPLFVIADKSKLSKESSFNKKQMPKDEIYDGTNDKITIDNYYFEEVPIKHITKIITD